MMPAGAWADFSLAAEVPDVFGSMFGDSIALEVRMLCRRLKVGEHKEAPGALYVPRQLVSSL